MVRLDSIHIQPFSIPASNLLSGLPVDQVKRYTSVCSLDEEAVHGPCKLLLSVHRHSKKRRPNSHLDACSLGIQVMQHIEFLGLL